MGRAVSSNDMKSYSFSKKFRGLSAQECVSLHHYEMENGGYTFLFSNVTGEILSYGREEGSDYCSWRLSGNEENRIDCIELKSFIYLTNYYGLVNSDHWERCLYQIFEKKMIKLQNYVLSDPLLTCSLYLLFQEMTVNSIEQIHEKIMRIQDNYRVHYENIFLDMGDVLYVMGKDITAINCEDYKIPRQEINQLIKQGTETLVI